MCNLPAVSNITISLEFEFANFIDSFAIFVTSLQSSIVKTGTSTDFPTTCNCFIAAGLYTSHATRRGFLFCFKKCLASFPA